jgi:hypothetical protein
LTGLAHQCLALTQSQRPAGFWGRCAAQREQARSPQSSLATKTQDSLKRTALSRGLDWLKNDLKIAFPREFQFSVIAETDMHTVPLSHLTDPHRKQVASPHRNSHRVNPFATKEFRNPRNNKGHPKVAFVW